MEKRLAEAKNIQFRRGTSDNFVKVDPESSIAFGVDYGHYNQKAVVVKNTKTNTTQFIGRLLIEESSKAGRPSRMVDVGITRANFAEKENQIVRADLSKDEVKAFVNAVEELQKKNITDKLYD
jgi:hypothetical protein